MSFLIIIIFVTAGWLSKQYRWLNKKQTNLINQYVISVCLPSIALLKIPQLQLEWSLFFPMFMGWLLIPFLSFIIYLLAKHYRWSGETVGCLLLLTCFGNTSFVGFPIIQSFYGDDALAYAIVYDQLGSFLSLAIVGNFFVAKYSVQPGGQHLGHIRVKELMIKVLLFPPFIALIIAFLLDGIYLNEVADSGLSLIGKTLVPATMFLVGLHFEFKLPKKHYIPLAWALATKMLIAPIIAFSILIVFQQSGISSRVTFMEAAMPPMVTASILAIHAKLSPQLASAAVGYGLILAIVVMPLIYWLSDFIGVVS